MKKDSLAVLSLGRQDLLSAGTAEDEVCWEIGRGVVVWLRLGLLIRLDIFRLELLLIVGPLGF